MQWFVAVVQCCVDDAVADLRELVACVEGRGLEGDRRVARAVGDGFRRAIADAFDYIGMFNNPVRRQGSARDLSPIEYEKRYALRGS